MQEFLTSSAANTRTAWAACRSSAIPIRSRPTLADLSKPASPASAFSLVNYLNELPYFCDEVMPRLERMGIREKPRLS